MTWGDLSFKIWGEFAYRVRCLESLFLLLHNCYFPPLPLVGVKFCVSLSRAIMVIVLKFFTLRAFFIFGLGEQMRTESF